MKNAKIAAAIVLFAGLAAPAFSGDGERRISLQASPLPYINDIVYLFADSNVKTFNIAVDIEFQYAVSRHFNFSMAGALSFENYPSVYIQSGGGYEEDYGRQFEAIFYPGLLYRPFGSWLKGMYVSVFPIFGWTRVSVKYQNDSFTHAGLGFLPGYQWVLTNGFTIQLGAGINKVWIIPARNNKGEYREKNERRLLNLPVDVRLLFRIGYSF